MTTNELIEQIGGRQRLIDTANEDIQFFESVRLRRGKLFDLEEENLALIRIALNALTTTPSAASAPDGLADAVNRLLDVDGSRGTFSAIRRSDALAEVERLLAAAPAPGGEK